MPRDEAVDEASARALQMLIDLEFLEKEYQRVEVEMARLNRKRGELANRLMELRLRVLYGSAIVLMFVLLTASSASAQTHPCDVTPPTTGSAISTTPLFAEWCQPLTNAIDAVTVYRGGTPTKLTPLEQQTPTANAGGLVQYRVSIGPLPAGTHTIELAAWNKNQNGVAQEGPRSLPFTLTVAALLPAPVAPSRVRVTP